MVHVVWHLVEPCTQLVNVHLCNLCNVVVPDSVGEGFAVESLSLAVRTLNHGHELLGPSLTARTVVVFHHAAKILYHTVEAHKVVARGVDKLLGYAYLLKRTVENGVQRVVGNVGNGRFQSAVGLLEYGLYLPEYHLVLVFSERCNATVAYAQLVVGDDFLEVYLVHRAQPLALRTSSFGRVEREYVWRGVLV